ADRAVRDGGCASGSGQWKSSAGRGRRSCKVRKGDATDRNPCSGRWQGQGRRREEWSGWDPCGGPASAGRGVIGRGAGCPRAEAIGSQASRRQRGIATVAEDPFEEVTSGSGTGSVVGEAGSLLPGVGQPAKGGAPGLILCQD